MKGIGWDIDINLAIVASSTLTLKLEMSVTISEIKNNIIANRYNAAI